MVPVAGAVLDFGEGTGVLACCRVRSCGWDRSSLKQNFTMGMGALFC